MPQIRPKSTVILLSDDHTKHVVSAHSAAEENPAGFHRLIGGGIEFGELRRDAAQREIVFVDRDYMPPGNVDKRGGTCAEADGCPLNVIWRNVTETSTTLYPNGAQQIVSELAASLACTCTPLGRLDH